VAIVATLTVEQALLRADGHLHKGEFDSARALYAAVLDAFPHNALARQGLARVSAALSPASASQMPSNAQIEALIGLYNEGRFQDQVERAEAVINQFPSSFIAWNIHAAGHQALGHFAEAEQGFRRAAELNPAFVDAYNNLGNALKFQGKFDEAIAAFRRALEIAPQAAEIHYNMGNALQEQRQLDAAIAAYQRALEIRPDLAEAYNNIGNVLKEQGRLEQASAAYRRALAIRPTYADAYGNLGNALQEQGLLDVAIAAYQRALEIWPDYAEARAQMLHQQQHICDFTVPEGLSRESAHLGIATDAVPSFAALTWEDNPKHHLLRAIRWTEEKCLQQSPLQKDPPNVRPKRLKVGYFGSDFHDHATMYLMAGLLREHDRTRFEIFAYSYGRAKTGAYRETIERSIENFFDVTDFHDRQIADLAQAHQLDIAIDLKGYTEHTRSQIFQHRLAPVQISYLGYPGSMGAQFIDYMIADPVVIPPEQREFYSEKVIFLPHAYQPNDNQRKIVETASSRASCDLPESGPVFACFNQSYKISSVEFDIWMRILRVIDGSVLWLLKSNDWAEINLRKEATLRGVDASRLIFAPKLPHAEHLARHKHADLFLDTFNYNAHTTASDALWAGLPVVTRQGKQFAARVAASLLTAVGLPELIGNDEGQYEAIIMDLGRDPRKIAEIKAKLSQNRRDHPLFDTVAYTRNFEAGLLEAYERYFEGLPADDIWLSAVAS